MAHDCESPFEEGCQLSTMVEEHTPLARRRPGLITRLSYRVEDLIDEWDWGRVFFHFLAGVYLGIIIFFIYYFFSIRGHRNGRPDSDKLPIVHQDYDNYFGAFRGFSECSVRAADLYVPPDEAASSPIERQPYCGRRQELLEAMSSGGRIGFDAPYFPRDCQYRWYTIEEICMILERFDAVVFVGDHSLQTVYNGLNILLRRDLAHGTLKTWFLDKETLEQCRCENQFTSEICAGHFVTSSTDVTNAGGGGGQGGSGSGSGEGKKSSTSISTYACARTPHAFLRINNSPAPESVRMQFERLVPRVKRSNYHPVAIVHSLAPSTVPNRDTASASLLEFLGLADAARRKTPMLWLGPTAAGHTEVKGRHGNQEVWDFDAHVARVAVEHDVEVLHMWNLTVQATSWDGLRYGEKVAITQAMMVVNWLARLPSS